METGWTVMNETTVGHILLPDETTMKIEKGWAVMIAPPTDHVRLSNEATVKIETGWTMLGVTTIDRIRLLNENITDATPALRRHEIIVKSTRDGEAKVRDVQMVTPPLPKSEQHALQPCNRMPAC